MRRLLAFRVAPMRAPFLSSFLTVSSVAATSIFPFSAQAQTKPSVQVPAVKPTQAQALVQQLLREGKIMRARDAKPGMTGYALSVFKGTTIEKFSIEVIGVLENINGGGDAVLFRATSGTVLKRQSSIVEGMSGSPVYINGKLLGAISFGYKYSKEAIGGITPITDMITTTLPDPARAKSVAPSGATKPATGNAKDSAGKSLKTSAANAQLSTRNVLKQPIGSQNAQVFRPLQPLNIAGRNIANVIVSRDLKRAVLSGGAGSTTITMRPTTMLLQVSGVSSSSLGRLTKVLEPYGIEPIASGAMRSGAPTGGGVSSQVFSVASKKSGVIPAFVPGGAIGVQMVSGDVDMTSIGTITYRIGNRVLAFGHPMFGAGNISLPMTSVYVYDIFPSVASSFKLAAPVQTLGAIQQDTNFAIGGTIGARADTVPMTLTIRNQSRQILKTFRMQIMKDLVLTPTLIQNVAADMVDSTLGKDSNKMVSLSLRLKLRNQPDIVRRNFLYAAGDIVSTSLSDLGDALMITQSNPFERGAIERVDVNVNVLPVRQTARIKNIFADRNKIKAGQTVRVSVEIEPTNTPGQSITKVFSFAVPADAPTGVLRVAAGTSGEYWSLATRVGNVPPDPQTLRELIDAYAKMGAQNELMVQASTPRIFLLVDRTRVPNPPGSWSRLLRQSASSSVASYNDTQTQTAPVDYSLSGNAFLAIPVESMRHSDAVAPDATGTTATNPSDGATSVMMVPPTTGSTPAGAGNDFDDSSTNSDNAVRNSLQLLLPQLMPRQNAKSAAAPALSSYTNFEKSLGRGLQNRGFKGAFSPIEYSIWSSREVGAQRLQAPTDPNAPKPQNPIVPGAGEIVKPTPIAVPLATATPIVTPTATPTPSPTPVVDNGTNLGRPSSSWIQNSALDFTRGDFSGAQVTSDGTIQLSPRVKQLLTTTETFAWSVAGDKFGNTFIGTGNNARIYKIAPDGSSKIIYSGKEIAVTALTTDDAGNLYAGVSPNGRVLRFAPNSSNAVTIFSSGDAFIWVLKLDPKGRLLIGSGGEKGHLYRLDTSQKISAPDSYGLLSPPFFNRVIGKMADFLNVTVPQKHVRAIATRGDDIFIGTSDDGVLYRVDGTSGKTTALYEVTGATSDLASSATDSGAAALAAAVGAASVSTATATTASGTEILAVAATKDGVYFGTSSNGTLYRWTESGVTAVYPTPQSSIYALQTAPDGTLIAATGEKGIVYQFRTNANSNDTTGARILEPTQTQALSLSIAPGGDLLIGTGNNAAVYRGALSDINSGVYTSNVFDAKNIVQWGAIRVIGGGVQVQTRSGNTVEPDANWSDWRNSPVNALGEMRVESPNARYLQYRVTLSAVAPTSSTGNQAKAPQLSRIEVSYRAKNTPPQVAWSSPVGGEFWRTTKKLTWAAQDANNDRLRSTIAISSDDGATWKPLELKDATATSLDLDTTKFADGTYLVKVQTSDILSNPDDPQNDTQSSAPFTIDNTSPAISNAAYDAANLKIVATVNDALSPISGAEWHFVGADKPKVTPTPKATPTPKSPTSKSPTSSTRSAAATPTAKAKTTDAPIQLVVAKPETSVTTSPTDDWHAMSALDGIFDSRRVSVVANIDKSDLDAARTKFGAGLQIEIRARDAAGNSTTAKISVLAG